MDKEIRNKNLYDALISHIEFANYLESYGEKEVDFKRINYNLLIALFAGNYLESTLDPYIKKVKNDKGDVVDVEIELVPEFLNNLASIIATDNGKGYTIGELSYRNASVLLDKIRNKLAHGDFIIDGDTITFEENKALGNINIDDLMKLIGDIDINIRKFTLKEECITLDINSKYVKDRSVHGPSSFKKFCKDLLILKVIDKPKEGHKRTKKYTEIVKQINEMIFKQFVDTELNEEEIKKLLNSPRIKSLMDIYNIEIDFKVQSVSELDYYETIKNNFFDNNAYTNQLYGVYLASWIGNRITKLEKGRFQNYNLNKGILLNICILKMMKEKSIYNYKEIIQNLCDNGMANIVLNDIDNTVVAANIVGFNSFYQYGLEDSLAKRNKNSIFDLAVGNTIDFSLFDLSLLEDPNMIIKDKFECFNEEIEELKQELKNTRKIDGIKKAIDCYKKFDKNFSLEVLENKNKKLLDAYKEKEELKEKILLCQEYLNNMDFNNFIKNYNIITFIRNANAHGKILIDENVHSDDMSSKKVRITNEYEGIVYYQKELSIYDFAILFKMGNFYALHEFYASRLKDKSQIDYDYIELLNERINKNKLKVKK